MSKKKRKRSVAKLGRFVRPGQKKKTQKKRATAPRTASIQNHEDNKLINQFKVAIGRKRLGQEDKSELTNNKESVLGVICRKMSLRRMKMDVIPIEMSTNPNEDLSSITIASNRHLKQANAKLKKHNKEQKKKLTGLESENQSLKNELKKLESSSKKSETMLQNLGEMVETERKANCVLKERIHNERKSRVEVKNATIVTKKLKKDMKIIIKHGNEIEDENEELNETNENACRSQNNLKTKVIQQENVIQQLNQNIEKIIESNNTLTKRRGRTIERIAKQKKEELDRLESQRKELKTVLKEREKKFHRIKKSKGLMHKKNNKLMALNSRLSKRIIKRNETIEITNERNEELSFQLQLSLTEAENNAKTIERERDHKGRKVWPLVVMKIIVEMLVNGTLPSAVCKNLESTCRLTCPNVEIKELPSIDYVRKCRGNIRIMTEACAAYILAKNKDWKQIFIDATSRRQTSMTSMSAGIMKDNLLKPIMLTCSKVGMGETSKDTVDIFNETLEDGKEHITKLKKTCEREHPEFEHDIPSEESLSLINCEGSAFTNDTRDHAYKS